MHFEMDCFSSIKYKLDWTFAEHLIPINLKYPFPHTAPDFPSPQTFLAVDATHLC